MKGVIRGDGDKAVYLLDGREVSQGEFFAALAPRKSALRRAKVLCAEPCSLIGWKPIWSEAMAVHPKRIAEAMEHDRKHGVSTRYDKYGRPEFVSRQHRRAYIKSYRVHDRQGGYGDG